MRLLPQSLFGRMTLVLFGGLIVAQLLSAFINFAERDRLLLRASGMQPAQRIADIVKLLDSFGPAERGRIVAILNAPPQIVSLEQAPMAGNEARGASPHAAMFSAVLRSALGDDRPVRVVVRETPSAAWPAGFGPGRHPGMMGARRAGTPEEMTGARRAGSPEEVTGARRAGSPEEVMGGPGRMPGPHRFAPGGLFFLTQVQLLDGTWVTFDTLVPRESAGLPWRLLLTLLVLLAAVLILSFVAVRWITRPLHVLASAAEELGQDINRPPLPEAGPLEVRRAAHAFNTMQARLARFIQDRTRILTAMSHDLKTPITRMRLRADLLEDDDLRARFEKDLKDMESMVTHTLDFMRGLDSREPPQPVDIMALLESLQADNEEMKRDVLIEGQAAAPYSGDPQRLKRCLANLIDNAVIYGRRAKVVVTDTPAELTITVRDEGPGIPAAELEKVFEPFYRLEASRSRETGGSGLGLGIARNIAQAEGGDVRVRNHPDGGLEAILILPRSRRGGSKA